MPQTSTDLVNDPGRRWGDEFARRPDMPSMIGPNSPPNLQAAAPTSSQEQK